MKPTEQKCKICDAVFRNPEEARSHILANHQGFFLKTLTIVIRHLYRSR